MSNDPYFSSRAARYCFALCELDGQNRARILGVSRRVFRDPSYAKAWRSKIARTIKTSGHPMSEKALRQLDKIYDEIAPRGRPA